MSNPREHYSSKRPKPLAENPPLRVLLQDLKKQFEQIIDEISRDELRVAGMSEEAREKARELVQSFETFLEANKDEIEALQYFYQQPYGERLHFSDVRALADAISSPPRSWTPERLWHAYETLDRDKVRGASGTRLLTDLVSLVRFALHTDEELVPYQDQVNERFDHWMQQQANTGRTFGDEQTRWLEMMRDHVATSIEVRTDDFDATPFAQEGGLARAAQLFGGELVDVLAELNEALVA